MLRRRLALPALLTLFGLVWAGAHAVAHDIVTPTHSAHAPAHGQALESYVAYAPTSFALCLALALALATGAAFGKRWTGSSGRSLWLFGVVPVLGFAVDTLVELPAHGQGTLAGTAVVAAELVPALLVGLLVQLPFALVAFGLASRILWLAEGLAWALRAPREAAPPPTTGSVAWKWTTRAPAFHLDGASRSRAPPAALIA